MIQSEDAHQMLLTLSGNDPLQERHRMHDVGLGGMPGPKLLCKCFAVGVLRG